MLSSATFTNFKALRRREMDFGKITVLAGLNSAGKSSVIQGVLLVRSFINYLRSRNIESYSVHNFPLNGSFMLNLGSANEVISRDSGKEFLLTINVDSSPYELRFYTEKSLADDIYYMSVDYSSNLRSLGLLPFYYLNAERLGPRIRHEVNENDGGLYCGYQGEYTIDVLARTKAGKDDFNYEVASSKYLNNQRLEGFQTIPNYVTQWMNFIAPGTDIGDANVFGKLRSSVFSVNGNNPPNVGFGISYVLPIVVTGLLAPSGSTIVVENPEAHLHPKGQSNIGFFLGQIAASGVQVIVETHSEHVINGIRKAALTFENLTPADVKIHFFSGLDEDRNAVVESVLLNDSSVLTSFPVDFFDQVNQDIAEIFELRNVRANGTSID